MARLRTAAGVAMVAALVLAGLPAKAGPVAASLQKDIQLAQAQPGQPQTDPGPAARPGGGVPGAAPTQPAPGTLPRPGSLMDEIKRRIGAGTQAPETTARSGTRRVARSGTQRRVARASFQRPAYVRRCYLVPTRASSSRVALVKLRRAVGYRCVRAR